MEQVVGIPPAQAPSEGVDEYIRPSGCAAILQQKPTQDFSPRLIRVRNDGHREITSADASKQYLLHEGFAE